DPRERHIPKLDVDGAALFSGAERHARSAANLDRAGMEDLGHGLTLLADGAVRNRPYFGARQLRPHPRLRGHDVVAGWQAEDAIDTAIVRQRRCGPPGFEIPHPSLECAVPMRESVDGNALRRESI